MADPQRCAVVAILGAPNAGKSTLVNRLVGTKVAIVTHKVQTTRAPLRGVAMRGQTQLVLIDTPGVFQPKKRLERAMVRAAWGSGADADRIVHLVDAASELGEGRTRGGDARSAEDVEAIIAALKAMNRKDIVLALNKVDSLARPPLLALTQKLFAAGCYSDVFMISALNGSGVDDLANHLVAGAPEGPWLYPEDDATDAPLRVLAAEITREKLMLRLHDELPYEAMVETESWTERKDGSVRVDQIVYVMREGQRKIAIGQNAATIKAIGEAARKEMEAAFERRVHLFLHVKLKENWSEERARYTAMGLDYDV